MDILDIIRKVQTKTNLSATEESAQTQLRKLYNAKGVTNLCGYIVERPQLRNINARSLNLQTKLQHATGEELVLIDPSNTNDILSKVLYYPNTKSKIKLPYLTGDGVVWGDVITDDNYHISTKELECKRLSTYIDVSDGLVMQDKTYLNNYISSTLNNAIRDKVISTMFSNNTDVKAPKGLFTYKQSKELSKENLKDSFVNITNAKFNGTWIMSPSCYMWIYNNCSEFFDNGKMLGFEYMVDGRVENDYMAFVDLSKIAVADWTVSGVIIDNVTHKKDGITRVFADSFVDFNIIDNNAIEVLKIED